MKEWLTEAAAQARNGLPVPLAVVGEHAGYIQLDSTIKMLGGLYIVLQIGYLIWKWRKEHKNGVK